MLIFWGTKKVIEKLGHVADFCQICRSIQRFRIEKHSLRSHLYYLPYGAHKNIQHLKFCSQCQESFEADIGRYKTLVRKQAEQLPMPDVIRATFPDIYTVYKDTLASDKAILANSMSLDPRVLVKEIRDTFVVYEKKFRDYDRSLQIDAIAMAAIVAGIASPFAVALLLEHTPLDIDARNIALLATLVLATIGIIWAVAGTKKRYLIANIYPQLAKALQRFAKQQGEIEKQFALLRQNDFKIAQKAAFAQLKKLL